MVNHRNGSEALGRLRDARARIDQLLLRLGQANKAFANAARPLDNLSELDSQQRQELAARIRAANQEWEEVTNQINEAIVLLDQSVR
jgi:hypothetical protein